ncbi:AMP-binding protein [Candidatus Neomarinimicrobiota bacterium]
MNKKYIINGIHYDLPDLVALCGKKIRNEKTPVWERLAYNFIQEWLSPATYIEIKTSGSTGKPKAIKLSKELMRNSAAMTARVFKLKKNDNVLCCLPKSFIAGKMMVVRALENTLNLILVKPISNPITDLENIRIHLIAVVPSQLHTILFDFSNRDCINQVENLLVGGGKVPDKIRNAVKDLSTKVYQTYGMTETASHVAMRALNGPDSSDNYQAIENNHFAITEDHRLIISAPQLGIKKLETQDIVELVNPQEFKWLGRADNIINSGGVKINPETIEERIECLMNDYNYFVSSRPDDILGEIVILVIESHNWDDNHSADLYRNMKKILRTYEIPKKIFSVKKFIYTESHKINRITTLDQLLRQV